MDELTDVLGCLDQVRGQDEGESGEFPQRVARCLGVAAGAFRPVPIAVAPRLISWTRRAASSRRVRSSSIITEYVANSWPSVIGTASWSWVRPIFTVSANSTALVAKASCRTRIASSRSSIAKIVAMLTAVG